MNLPIRLAIAARQDRERLAAFLTEHNPQAAMDALETIAAGLNSLSQHPHLGHSVDDGLRELSIRFGASGYVVRYRVDPDAVVVARIFHMRENR